MKIEEDLFEIAFSRYHLLNVRNFVRYFSIWLFFFETRNSAIFRKVVAGELPNAFKKVEDDKIKAIIKSCIEPKPEERITVHQLLENDFFEEKYLKVLDVGKNGNELKLRLVVNEPGVNNRRMPEDEAIDFTFHIGVDTALQVAQVSSINNPTRTVTFYQNLIFSCPQL